MNTWEAPSNGIMAKVVDLTGANHFVSVFTVGFSHGGRVSYLLGGSGRAKIFAPSKRRFVATVAVYGRCFNREYDTTFLRPDIDRLLLSLLGGLDEDGIRRNAYRGCKT